jgi:tetratricopeptide (TPR) repeat protein
MSQMRWSALFTAGLMIATAGMSFAQKPKSQKEVDALMAIQNAADNDGRLTAIENLLTKFADTEYKVIVLEMAAEITRAKGDAEQTIIYCERTIEADPNNLAALTMLAKTIAEKTREFDLDKEEKLTRSDGYASKVIALGPTAKKTNGMLTDEQWTGRVKDLVAQAHEAKAAAAFVRKKNDIAIAEYKLAIDAAATPDPSTMVRLGMVYNAVQKYDDAIAILDKAIAGTDNAQIKQVAGQEKVKAATAKAKAAPAAAPAKP